jgi:beta-lactamase class A
MSAVAVRAAAALDGAAVAAVPGLPEPLASRVAELERGFSGTIAVWVHDLGRRETYGLRADEQVRPASTIKMFVLRELLRRADAGELSLEDEVVMERRDVVPGSGVIKDLTPGLRLSLRDTATLMVTVSDNTATNLLIDRLGTRAINRATVAAGFGGTHLGGKLFRGGGPRSRTTARDLGTLMTQIARRRAVSRGASGVMLDILRREQYDTIIGRFLPADEQTPSSARVRWKVASKSGSIVGHRHDVAFVEGPGVRYVLALMSWDCADHRFWVDNEAHLCLAHAARAVHDHVDRAG